MYMKFLNWIQTDKNLFQNLYGKDNIFSIRYVSIKIIIFVKNFYFEKVITYFIGNQFVTSFFTRGYKTKND